MKQTGTTKPIKSAHFNIQTSSMVEIRAEIRKEALVPGGGGFVTGDGSFVADDGRSSAPTVEKTTGAAGLRRLKQWVSMTRVALWLARRREGEEKDGRMWRRGEGCEKTRRE